MIASRTPRHLTHAAGFVLALFLASAAEAQDSLDQRIDAFVRAEMERQHVPGVAIGVVKGGTVIKAQGYGFANLEHRVPVTPETIFESGSLGKQFTAAAVMLQVEDGRLSLSDPLTKFFPDAPPAWKAITVRHLLTHTSGLPDYVSGMIDERRDYTEEELARFAFALSLEFPAGSRWNYSNTGYVLLGIIVHKVSGMFYGDVLATRVFQPTGMATTRVISEADIVPNRAAGYQLEKGEVKNQSWVSPTLNTTADGSLYFSVRDLLAWEAAVRARGVLKPASWHEVLQPVRLASGKTYPYGFGWGITERGGQPLHEHGGAWQGFQTQFSRFIGDDLSIVVLANLAQADRDVRRRGCRTHQPEADRARPRTHRGSRPAGHSTAVRPAGRRACRHAGRRDFACVRAGFFPPGRHGFRSGCARSAPCSAWCSSGERPSATTACSPTRSPSIPA
jgi:CubicO group peptidase (beta-lactamase class C family)